MPDTATWSPGPWAVSAVSTNTLDFGVDTLWPWTSKVTLMKAVFWSALIWWEPMGVYGLWTTETWGSFSTLAIMVLMEASTEGSVTRVPLVV